MRSLRGSANWKAGTGRISLVSWGTIGSAAGCDGGGGRRWGGSMMNDRHTQQQSCRLPAHALEIERKTFRRRFITPRHTHTLCIYVRSRARADVCVCVGDLFAHICTMDVRCGPSAKLSPLRLTRPRPLPLWNRHFPPPPSPRES